MRDLRIAHLQTIEARIVEAIARADLVDAFGLLLLVRGYRARGGDDLREQLEAALSRALAAYQNDTSVDARTAWLGLFVEAMTLSDDERLQTSARHLIDELHSTWAGSTDVAEAAASIDGCLRASRLPEARALAADAIDALERIVASAYVPGQGMARTLSRSPRARGSLGDQVRAASALLTAYEVSGRLPYAMLAEELMQLTGRQPPGDDFVLNCEAARVLSRLAALHEDADYRAAAVVVPGVDYRRDAERILAAQASQALACGTRAAIYALALVELECADSYDD